MWWRQTISCGGVVGIVSALEEIAEKAVDVLT